MEKTRLIEAYLDGSLDDFTVAEIRARADADREFAALILLHREINESIRDTDLHELRKKIRAIIEQDNKISSWILLPDRHAIQIAAAVALLFLVGVTILKWIVSGHEGSGIYSQYYEKFEPDVITRSKSQTVSTFQAALNLYESGEYDNGADSLLHILNAERDNWLAWYYLGVTRLEQNNINEAIEDFQMVPDNWNNPYAIHRGWYLSLAFIRNHHTKQAIPLLKSLANDRYYSKRAREILRKIDK